MIADGSRAREWYPLPKRVRAIASASRNSVLLETAKQTAEHDRSFLFLNPSAQLLARTNDDLESMFQAVERHLAEGAYLAGFFSYECGEHFVGLGSRESERSSPMPLAWLGIYKDPIVFDHSTGTLSGPFLPEGLELTRHEVKLQADGLEIDYEQYEAKITRIKEYLLAGDTYQVNFTDRMTGTVEGDLLSLFEDLLSKQPVPYAAFLNLEETALLSFSPELFFQMSGRNIVVKPMKGTWPRGKDVDEDLRAAALLQDDAKNRSEHVMIVDLLRNDLGKISEAGSVHVEELFSVERYRTLLQMTSTISGPVSEGVTACDAFRSLFPSGSITGAPKRRTMEIIRELESEPRGAYTGAIGYFSPNGDACFNVAIRTLAVGDGSFTLGVGGGITAGSETENEYEECQLKGSILTHAAPEFSLIETMRSVSGTIPLLVLHLQRLQRSANYFDFRFELEYIEQQLLEAARNAGDAENRIRMELNAEGEVAITAVALAPVEWKGRLLLAEQPTLSQDVFLRHKTTNRDLYEKSLAEARALGFDEVVFLNEQGQVTEGAINNIFLGVGERWLTPSLDSGVLPGVERSVLLDELPNADEGHFSLEDLKGAHTVLLCNALRGARKAASIETAEGNVIWNAEYEVL
jgi:para-aminobenzoate synthetase/4-amino-4-deoxychorismate lyase